METSWHSFDGVVVRLLVPGTVPGTPRWFHVTFSRYYLECMTATGTVPQCVSLLLLYIASTGTL